MEYDSMAPTFEMNGKEREKRFIRKSELSVGPGNSAESQDNRTATGSLFHVAGLATAYA